MTDKMMRVAGRDPDGLAKGFKTDKDGNLGIQIEGSKSPIETMGKKSIYPVSDLKMLNIPTYDGSNQPTHPSVVYIASGFGGYKYWMAFTPYPFSNNRFENPSIVASNDGENFVVPKGLTNPIDDAPTSPNFNRDVELIYNVATSELWLYWSDNNGTYRKKSSDGVVWSVEEVCIMIPSSERLGALGIVLLRDGTFQAFSALNSETNAYMKFSSPDGLTWTRRGSVRTNLRSSWHLSTHSDSTGIHFLEATNPPGQLYRDHALYYGFSDDGEEVTFDSTPFLIPETEGWTARHLYRSCMIRHSNQNYRIYVSARNLKDEWRVGFVDVQFNDPGDLLERQRTPHKHVVHKAIFKNREIRNTSTIYGMTGGFRDLPELKTFENKALMIYSSLDQPITISIFNDLRLPGSGFDWLSYGGTATENRQLITVPNALNKPFLIDKNHLPALGVPLIPGSTIGISCGVAPTTGDLTVFLIAW